MAVDPLAIIAQRESGNRNIRNYKYGPGFTASGYWQITNPTWARWAKAAGIDLSRYPTAESAPYDVQRQAAAHGYQKEGFRPWEAVKHLRGQEANYPVQPAGVMDSNPSQNNPASTATASPYNLSTYTAHKGVDTSGFGGALNQGLGRAFADMPPELKASIYSGYRSREHQQRLWDASDKTGHMVARPGHSQHGFGNAADLRFASPAAREWLHANAAKYGLAFPLAHEPWHVEAAGARPDGKPVNYALGVPGAMPGPQVASATGAPPSSGQPAAPVVDPASPEALTQAGMQQLGLIDQPPAGTEQAPTPVTEPPPSSVTPPVPAQPVPEQTNAATLMASLIDRKREERGVPARMPPGFLETGIFG